MPKIAAMVGFVIALAAGAPRRRASHRPRGSSPWSCRPARHRAGEIQKLFDAYTLIQAQEALKLSKRSMAGS